MLKGKRVNQILCMSYLVERLKSLLLGFPITTDTDTDTAKISLAQASQGAWQYLCLGRVNMAWHS